MVRVWMLVAVVVGALTFAAWASDFVTRQGERTVYTVECVGGDWQGDDCSGDVTTGPRYRYRAVKSDGEVHFWTIGASEPPGRFEDCAIQDGRNWTCEVCPDASRSITLQMAHGIPVPTAQPVTRPFRAVSKWRWMLLKRGFTADRPVRARVAATKVT